MSAERGGLLKSRAEDFARHLQRRLRSLSGTEDGGGGSWTEAKPSDAEVYYDIDSSLASPQEELPEPIFIASQNRDNLQRSESSSSEYFDTLEELPSSPTESSTSVPFLKKIPILHLKTEKPTSLTNGHKNIIDADLGCSRVHEMPCEEFQLCVSESSIPAEENCDIPTVENNNTWTEVDDVTNKTDKLDLEPVLALCNGDVVSVETHSEPCMGETSSDQNEATEALGNKNCVFCDIEQAKSSFTNSCTESIVSQKKDQRSSRKIDNSADKEPDKQLKGDFHLKVPVDPSSECSSDTEESVPLKDLLQVLKKEISRESEETEVPEAVDSKTSEGSAQSCSPSIEVRESTPPSTTNAVEPKDKEEEFNIEMRRKNFRRCSSLKCGKTPPGTPGRKKIVRFADVLGLDLADIKTFMDEVPTVPRSAYSDLHLLPDTDSTFSAAPAASSRVTVVTPQAQKVLVPLFQQPFLSPNFMDRVMANNVCLESASVSDMSLFAITGVVRVRNIDFHKSAYIRYSINSWRNYSDLQARYIPNSCDGFSDKFSFILYAHTLTVGQKLEFAVRYHTAGTQFWDSNGGLNYVFECIQQPLPQAISTPEIPPSPVESWASFL